ncbi:DNA-processing protein DprA [Metabacillus arenae]|uniref:DNA-protecting protein DprA n=1 Tax=Metabacillus arenae TaxID=2771434 RepID=A0A926NLJ7_9BACI|nr:DNA-processing protein DprA [Metabacillus arenae]MBD1380031.1 DNA-protecting protein DprA [Metabacillus arenae]
MISTDNQLLTLTHCRGITHKGILKLLSIDPLLIHLFSMREIDFYLNGIIPKDNLHQFYNDLHTFKQSDLFHSYKKQGIEIVTIHSNMYPALLKQISDPPPVLFCKGNISLLQNEKSISIVGTRNSTEYGLRAVESIVPKLVQDGWTLISGLALGIDKKVHEETIKQNGKTIAVIGGGLHHIYPKENFSLASKIMDSHLLLSEHPPQAPPQKWHFPMRNRIISGLSKGTVVIQAKEKSGSLITAYQALDQGREVFAVPGGIHDEYSRGTNQLIKEGAKMVASAKDIIEEF